MVGTVILVNGVIVVRHAVKGHKQDQELVQIQHQLMVVTIAVDSVMQRNLKVAMLQNVQV